MLEGRRLGGGEGEDSGIAKDTKFHKGSTGRELCYLTQHASQTVMVGPHIPGINPFVSFVDTS
jgi:hypothetical protein